MGWLYVECSVFQFLRRERWSARMEETYTLVAGMMLDHIRYAFLNNMREKINTVSHS